MTGLIYWKNQQHNEKSRQHNDVTNITVTNGNISLKMKILNFFGIHFNQTESKCTEIVLKCIKWIKLTVFPLDHTSCRTLVILAKTKSFVKLQSYLKNLILSSKFLFLFQKLLCTSQYIE